MNALLECTKIDCAQAVVPQIQTVIRGSGLTRATATAIQLLTALWYNNNNRFTAFVRDYPGEPVPEETPTHHPDHHPTFVSFFHLPRSISSL